MSSTPFHFTPLHTTLITALAVHSHPTELYLK